MESKKNEEIEEKEIYKRNFKSKNLIESIKNAVNGILYALKTQNNIKIQFLIAIIVIIVSIVLKCALVEIACLIFSITLVIFAELINTSFETTIDLITEDYNIKAKIVKDVAAGAVLLTAVNSILVGAIIFVPKIMEII